MQLDGLFGSRGIAPTARLLASARQWRDLSDAKLEKFFYAAILWGKSPFKVIEDAKVILKREKK